MKLVQVLRLPVWQQTRVVAGATGLEHEVRWVHMVDHPDLLPWVQAGQLLLTTGYTWPREEEGQRALIRALGSRNLAGVGLAVPHFFDHFPEAVCDEANQVHIPLLEIPWDLPFAQITEEVHRAILAEQYRMIEQSEAIHRALTRAVLEAESLQDLATMLGKHIERTVLFEDTDGQILADAHFEQEEEGPRQATREHSQRSKELLVQLDRLGYMRRLRMGSSALFIPALPDLDFSGGMICPIRLKEELVGFVWITGGRHALSDLDGRAAEHAAVIAALQIAHQRDLASKEAQFGSTFLDSLLEGRFEATPQALERAQLLGFNPEESYRVGLFLLNEVLPLSRDGFLRRERLASQLRQRLHFLDVAPLLSVSLNRVLFLLPTWCAGERIWSVLREKDLALAFGQAQVGVAGIQQSYREALSLLPYLSIASIHYYETLLLPRVLLGDQEARRFFLEELLGRFKGQRNGKMLLETLLTWARAGFEHTSTAEKLHIHQKTLHYRFARAAELAQLDLADPETRFRLHLAAYLFSLEGKNFA